jgi:hypothetical protein
VSCIVICPKIGTFFTCCEKIIIIVCIYLSQGKWYDCSRDYPSSQSYQNLQGLYLETESSPIKIRGCRGHMVVGFTTTCAISAYHN